MSERFHGFAAGARALALPEAFVSQLLPLLDGPSLAAALCALRILHRRRTFPRYLTVADLAADPALAAFLANAGDASLEGAVRRLVEAGMLLPLRPNGSDRELLFLNAPADRRGLEQVRSQTMPTAESAPPEAAGEPPPDVFVLYEENLGPLTPLVARELAEAAACFPEEWLAAAIREAATHNVHSWQYVRRILERWAVEGREHEEAGRDPAGDLDRYFRGRYGRLLGERFRSGR